MMLASRLKQLLFVRPLHMNVMRRLACSKIPTSSPTATVLYDGACSLCEWEISQ